MRGILPVFALLLVSCQNARYTNDMPPTDCVLGVGESISIQVGNDLYYIGYSGEDSRMIGYNKICADVSMIVRGSPFVAGLDFIPPESGIYNPGNTRKLGHNLSGTRIIYRESIRRFPGKKEFDQFVYSGSSVHTRKYGSDGIYLSISNSNNTHTMSIALYRIYVDGKLADFSNKVGFSGKLVSKKKQSSHKTKDRRADSPPAHFCP